MSEEMVTSVHWSFKVCEPVGMTSTGGVALLTSVSEYLPPQLRAVEKPSFFSALWDARIYFKSMSVGRMSIAKSSPRLRRISFIFERFGSVFSSAIVTDTLTS